MNQNKQYWIFTFGSGQKHEGYYVKINGTYGEAREKMFDRYGEEWSFQYSEEQWDNWLKTKPEWIPEESLLEIIN